jgi:ubiquinone/menaquinone biosynthesis C-methylase UbiE
MKAGATDPAEIGRIFDARAPRYSNDDWHRRYAEQFVAAVPLRAGDVVLDAGTGTGFAACAIARRIGSIGRVCGVDLSERMLAHARARLTREQLDNVELRRGDATELSDLEPCAFDAVLCSAGLLYMPVAKALREWRRLLKPRGVVAFSTMRAGSPSAGRVFRGCAAAFGVTLHDPSEPLGTDERCLSALEDAGFEVEQISEDRVNFETLDPETAWEANFGAAGHAAARALPAEQQVELRYRYLDALSLEMTTDAGWSNAHVLFAVGRRP